MKRNILLTAIPVLLLALVIFAYAADQQGSGGGQKGKAPVSFDKEQPIGTEATCPVTGEQFKIIKDNPHSIYKGKYYYFCCPSCKPKFDADPEKYIGKQ